MFNENEFNHLQKLACIKLNLQEKKKLWVQLINIIDFLDQLKNIKINISEIWIEDFKVNNFLKTISWIKQYENVNWLLKNVKYCKFNNNIVIKSVLS